MAPKRVHFAPRVRRVYSNFALKTRLENAMKQIRELKYTNQATAKRNEKHKTALNAISDKAGAALEADTADGEAMMQQVQALRGQVQSDLD